MTLKSQEWRIEINCSTFLSRTKQKSCCHPCWIVLTHTWDSFKIRWKNLLPKQENTTHFTISAWEKSGRGSNNSNNNNNNNKNKHQTTNNKQQTTNTKHQTTNNKQQTTNNNQQPTTNNQQQPTTTTTTTTTTITTTTTKPQPQPEQERERTWAVREPSSCTKDQWWHTYA